VNLPPDALGRVLWATTSPPAPATTALQGRAVADVAIVGAGILGLSAGLALAESGARVIVLEAATIGEGASGRNGGLAVPSLPRIGPDDVVRRLGEAGERLLTVVAGAAEEVFSLIRRHEIDCAAVQSGWLHPAHAASLAPHVAARSEAWRKWGARCVYLDAVETRKRMGSACFHGALFDPTGGHLDPLAYTRGLARAFIKAGGALHEQSPVVSIDPGFLLHTPSGQVAARTVLQCTNAQPPGISPAVRDSSVPLIVYQLATTPMSDAVRAALLPGNEAFSDTRNNLLACRWAPGGRLVTGGMATVHVGAMDRLPVKLTRRLEAVFPALGRVSFEFVWRGRAALTGDFLPRLWQPAHGWFAPVFCNGRGVALCTALGGRLAPHLLGQAKAPLPPLPPHPLRFPGLASLVPGLLLPLGDLQDWRAERR
jgi:glycine/D-amino acid oxidase-like deaminating enzyme